MKILITGGKTATALKLSKAFEGSELVLGDYGDLPKINSNAYAFLELGVWNEDVLAHNLLTKCLDCGADKLLPLYEAEIAALVKSLVLFDEFGIKVLLPENPDLNVNKFKDWCLFENGQLIYASVDVVELADSAGLNGAYTFDSETKELTLIYISNP